MKLKKTIFAIIFLILISGVSLIYYVLSHVSLDYLLICSSQPEKIPGPNALCEYYTVHYRGTKHDIDEFSQDDGLAFVFSAKKYKYKLIDFLLNKGVSINKISPYSGLTPLEAAVLDNDTTLVQYLLNRGADPLMKSGNTSPKAFSQLTPLELAKILQKYKKIPDRSAVIKILKKYTVRK